MLGQRRRQWTSVKPTLTECLLFAVSLVYVLLYVYSDMTLQVEL